MKFGSLFAGIGGFDAGLEAAGMECSWQVEINSYATKVLEKHWPDVDRWTDVRTFPPPGEWFVDLICGGFPCQPCSVAGLRKGGNDERWLWPEFKRVCSILRPKWLLAENVPGLLSAGDVPGELFGTILRDLAEIGYGYVEWDCISAASLGASHRRDRVWIVGVSDADNEGLEGRLFCGNSARKQLARSRRKAEQETWRSNSRVLRVAHGVPSRVDRIKCLGNAVCPEVVEFIGKRIMEVEAINCSTSSK